MTGARFLYTSLLSGLLAACAAPHRPAPVDDRGQPAEVTAEDRAATAAAPTEIPSTGEAVTIPLGEAPPPGASVAPPPAVQEQTPPGVDNPAVIALLNDANQAMQQGRNDRAAASLERALAIEPRNAWLWHRLASARLEQGELDQAASLAAKSNSLAADDRSLQAKNWRIIADVHRRRGDLAAARSAEDNAAQLSGP